MGGAWVASHIWEHYLFTKDRDFLKEYYPVLKGAAEFCIDWMTEDNNGKLITSPPHLLKINSWLPMGMRMPQATATMPTSP